MALFNDSHSAAINRVTVDRIIHPSALLKKLFEPLQKDIRLSHKLVIKNSKHHPGRSNYLVHCGFCMSLDYNIAANWIFLAKVFKMFVFDEIYENIILSLNVLIIFFTVEKKLWEKQLSYHTKNTEDAIFRSYVPLDQGQGKKYSLSPLE